MQLEVLICVSMWSTSYPTLDDDDILNFPIPFLPRYKQDEIKKKVIESFNLRKGAKDLLECAKRTVEIAIEQNEQTAIDRLESVSQVTELSVCTFNHQTTLKRVQ